MGVGGSPGERGSCGPTSLSCRMCGLSGTGKRRWRRQLPAGGGDGAPRVGRSLPVSLNPQTIFCILIIESLARIKSMTTIVNKREQKREETVLPKEVGFAQRTRREIGVGENNDKERVGKRGRERRVERRREEENKETTRNASRRSSPPSRSKHPAPASAPPPNQSETRPQPTSAGHLSRPSTPSFAPARTGEPSARAMAASNILRLAQATAITSPAPTSLSTLPLLNLLLLERR